ncbi:MAG: DUF4249 family protein [Bacteroidales bacterium]|nr:DUF4249 family protein [Candidatus Cryptobacteroides aphodequi]
MKLIRTILSAIFAFSVASCIYPYEVQESASSGALVIDGDILPGTTCSFTTRRVADLSSTSLIEVPGTISIESENGKRWTASSESGSAFHYVNLEDAPLSGRYRLLFTCSETGRKYCSEWQSVSKAPLSARIFYENDPRNTGIYANVNTIGGSSYVRTSFSETWEFVADYMVTGVFDAVEEVVQTLIKADDSNYYCWASANPLTVHTGTSEGMSDSRIPNLLITSIPRTDKRLSSLYRINVRITGISREEYEYLHNTEAISNTDGGLFTPTPGEIPGNISCLDDPSEKVIGFIGAGNYIEAEYYIHRNNVYIQPDLMSGLFVPDPAVSLLAYYNAGFRPVVDYNGWLWGPGRCIDCRLAGGSKTKPDGWPSPNK